MPALIRTHYDFLTHPYNEKYVIKIALTKTKTVISEKIDYVPLEFTKKGYFTLNSICKLCKSQGT